jgi:hypothetical protein
LAKHLAAHLPQYARPLFLRRCAAMEITGTFKLRKDKLAQEGIAATTDRVWFNDRSRGRYITCDAALLQSIEDGSRRL